MSRLSRVGYCLRLHVTHRKLLINIGVMLSLLRLAGPLRGIRYRQHWLVRHAMWVVQIVSMSNKLLDSVPRLFENSETLYLFPSWTAWNADITSNNTCRDREGLVCVWGGGGDPCILHGSNLGTIFLTESDYTPPPPPHNKKRAHVIMS